ncbi:glycoside hydrolase family 16 protein [Modestobacter sp. SYSU DS0657]
MGEGAVRTDGPPGDPASWRQVFGDDFNGTQIDRQVWRVNRYGGADDDGAFNPPIEGAYYSPDNVGVANGSAYLEIRPEPATVEGTGYTHSSGCLTTEDSFLLEDGDYVEARIWIPEGDQLWPAFWTVSPDSWPPEIDIAEFMPSSLQQQPVIVHHSVDGSTNYQSAYGEAGVDYRNGWHTYGLLRENGRLLPFLDGVPYPQAGLVAGADTQPQYIVLNLALYAGGEPTPETRMMVDFVRAWRRA